MRSLLERELPFRCFTWRACSRIPEDPIGLYTPLVLLDGPSGAGAVLVDMDGFITKPIQKKRLLEAIDTFVRRGSGAPGRARPA